MTEQPTAPQTDAPIEASESLQAETPRFSDLGLSEKVLAAVSAAGYVVPTPIQAQAIPIVLELRDIVGVAQTGTGKTASFVLPMLTRLEKGRARARMPRTLILEPTRELAAQVEENFNKYGINHKLTVALLIGGVSLDEQVKKLDRGVDVLIATPGRLLDLFERGRILMNGVEILVIDEADRMLDMGFIPDIERICKLLPFTRQTLFFSATMPPEIQRLTSQFLHNPVRVEVSRPSSTAETITQMLVKCPHDAKMKRETLRQLLRTQTNVKNGIIFANRKTTVALLEKSLKVHGFNAGALHGDMDQSARLKTLTAFRNNEITYLIASDVAARGLDIPEVSHVFNFDVPTHAEDYVHRIGRTGRAGREGQAFTMISKEEGKYWKAIEGLIKKEVPFFDLGPQAVSEDEGDDRPARSERPRRERSERSERKPREARPARGEARPEKPERSEQPKREREAPQPAAAPVAAAPRPERAPKPRRDDRHPQRDVKDAPDSQGFHDGNMPAFLMRSVKAG